MKNTNEHLSMGLYILPGPDMINHFFELYTPDQVEDTLLNSFHYAVGNEELGSGIGPQNMLSMLRNLSNLIYALDIEHGQGRE